MTAQIIIFIDFWADDKRQRAGKKIGSYENYEDISLSRRKWHGEVDFH
jgi:hypothetical protein